MGRCPSIILDLTFNKLLVSSLLVSEKSGESQSTDKLRCKPRLRVNVPCKTPLTQKAPQGIGQGDKSAMSALDFYIFVG